MKLIIIPYISMHPYLFIPSTFLPYIVQPCHTPPSFFTTLPDYLNSSTFLPSNIAFLPSYTLPSFLLTLPSLMHFTSIPCNSCLPTLPSYLPDFVANYIIFYLPEIVYLNVTIYLPVHVYLPVPVYLLVPVYLPVPIYLPVNVY